MLTSLKTSERRVLLTETGLVDKWSRVLFAAGEIPVEKLREIRFGLAVSTMPSIACAVTFLKVP